MCTFYNSKGAALSPKTEHLWKENLFLELKQKKNLFTWSNILNNWELNTLVFSMLNTLVLLRFSDLKFKQGLPMTPDYALYTLVSWCTSDMFKRVFSYSYIQSCLGVSIPVSYISILTTSNVQNYEATYRKNYVSFKILMLRGEKKSLFSSLIGSSL